MYGTHTCIADGHSCYCRGGDGSRSVSCAIPCSMAITEEAVSTDVTSPIPDSVTDIRMSIPGSLIGTASTSSLVLTGRVYRESSVPATSGVLRTPSTESGVYRGGKRTQPWLRNAGLKMEGRRMWPSCNHLPPHVTAYFCIPTYTMILPHGSDQGLRSMWRVISLMTKSPCVSCYMMKTVLRPY